MRNGPWSSLTLAQSTTPAAKEFSSHLSIQVGQQESNTEKNSGHNFFYLLPIICLFIAIKMELESFA